jgi:type VI protein secretion system component VasF
MGMVFSDLNLNGEAPVRVRPEVGEWGPPDVISTASKKRQRIFVVLAFVAAVVAVCLLGWFWYDMLMDSLTNAATGGG